MRRIILIFVIMLTVMAFIGANEVHAQAERVWEISEGCFCETGYYCQHPLIAVDDSGFFYLSWAYDDEIAIVKYDQMGKLLWYDIYGFGGNTATIPAVIKTDRGGNVYIAGFYDPDWTLGLGPHEMEIVILKYTPDGTRAWAVSYPVGSMIFSPTVGDIRPTADGDVYVYGGTGLVYLEWPPDPENPQYASYLFLIKCDAISGDIEWADKSNHGFPGVERPSRPGMFPGPNGEIFIGSHILLDSGSCISENGHDTTEWSRFAVYLAEYDADGNIINSIFKTGNDDFVPCDTATYLNLFGLGMAQDSLGNIYFVAHQERHTAFGNVYVYKFTPGLDFEWERDLGFPYGWSGGDILVDLNGDIIYGDQHYLVKLNSAGEIIWTGQGGGILAVDGDNDLYVAKVYSNWIDVYDHEEVDAYPDWGVATVGSAVDRMIVDSLGEIYVSARGWTSCDFVAAGRFAQDHYIRLWDADYDTLKSETFELFRVHNDPPYFTEDKLGEFETDETGFFAFPLIPDDRMVFPISMDNLDPDTLKRSDTLKVRRFVDDSTAVKDHSLVANMYSLHQDNMSFDSLGVPSYDTITYGPQNLYMDHADVGYNLVVSVEWDASRQYLESLEAGFRSMSNYLYDVTDGQARLDTVLIYDDSAHWDDADMRIYADNQQWPNAFADSINGSGGFTISFPRKWYGSDDGTRNHTYFNHPLNFDDPKDYRTKTHEFGHYAFGFFDEYIYWDPDAGKFKADDALRCTGLPVYGFMETQYVGNDPYRTEMSNSFHYASDLCRNTKQYCKRLASCWDYFESKFEGEYINAAHDTFFVEIYKPDDSDRHAAAWPNGYVYLEGPNNDMTSPLTLDYDIGSKIVFPEWPTDPAEGIMDVDVEVRIGGAPQPKAEVFLLKYVAQLTFASTKQGKTADNGRIWVLGAEDGDIVQSAGFSRIISKSGDYAEIWNSGEVTINGDSLTLDMAPVAGYFPLICVASLEASALGLQLTADSLFGSLPTLTYRPSTGGAFDYAFATAADGYDATMTEPPGTNGSATVIAADSTDASYFFTTEYTHAAFAPASSPIEFFGPSGESQILFDADNPTMEQALLLSSPYSIIRTGLTDVNIQASRTHCLSVYPNDAMTGSGLLRIYYSESDIVIRGGAVEDEASIKIFRWADAGSGWQEVGGTVDTVFNQVVETIDQPGVYAAFTSEGPVDAEDDHSDNSLPYRFELHQNYPNPFNPVTTIEYSLTQRSHVSIEIFNVVGQRVRTLVDRNESAGSYTVTWDGTDDGGHPVATGVYLYRFRAGEYVATRKMVLVK